MKVQNVRPYFQNNDRIFKIKVKTSVFVSAVLLITMVIPVYLINTMQMKIETTKGDVDFHFVNRWKGTNRSLTVVTAFFDLGKFPKGSLSSIRTSDTYQTWMKVYKFLKNPIVVYTDSQIFADLFTDLRKNYSSITKVVMIRRTSLWSFKIKPKIAEIYAQPDYPIFYPNTYIPDYTSVTHSKFTLVANAISAKLFPSDFYCWIDLGYFRDLVDRRKDYYLEVPSDFNKSTIGVTQINKVDFENVSVNTIILRNKNWIGGGLFLGRPGELLKFEAQYRDRVMYYLSLKLANVEQQMLYAMYTKSERNKNPISVEVQLYIPGTKPAACSNPWFYLGCLMYHEVNETVG